MARHLKTIAGDSSYRLHKIVFATSSKKNKNSKLLSIKYIKTMLFVIESHHRVYTESKIAICFWNK